MKNKRPKIPDDVKLKLWVLSGGRCEFPGCNKYVWRDGLTLKDDNFAQMAHLIAVSPNGPRGNAVLSPKLAKEFSNLMLLCLNHSKLIDGKHKNVYPLDFLLKYKAQHEARIRIQTAIGPDMATTVLQFIANIRERKMEIVQSHAYEAVLPKFPSDEKGILLDFTNKEGTGDKSYWKNFAKEINTSVQRALTIGNDRQRIQHLSVFAIGPIPLLIYLGNRIGGATPADIYKKHRDTDNWTWNKEPKNYSFKYKVERDLKNKSGSKIALVLSLSGKVASEEVKKVLKNGPLYEITIPTPDRDFLHYRSQLIEFSSIYRALLTEIRERHGNDCEIYIFPAIPVSIAVTCGRELLPKADPGIIVYDYDQARGGFVSTLKIN
jgi:hypothetical protein